MNRRLDQRGGMGAGLPDWRLLAIGGLLVVGFIAVILALVLSSGPNPHAGQAQPFDGQTHVTAGLDCRYPANASEAAACGGTNLYSSLPATSGPHWPPDAVANWGVYSTPQPETQLIHNLEHGGIVIWYDPERVDDDGVAAMASLVDSRTAQGVGGQFKWILTPWGGEDELPAPIVVTAWQYLLELETADIGAIEGFADAHYGEAPEPGGGPGPPS